MIKKNIILLLVSYSLFAQTAGNTGLSFLKNGASAKTIAVSDIGFLNGDISSVFYNPATVNFQESASVMFTHQAWIQDLNSEIVNANFSMFGLPFSVGANTTKISDFEIRTKPSELPDATFDVNYFYGSLSTGFNLYEQLYFGLSIKYLYESLLADDATGFGYDFGLVYKNIVENLNLGASIRNLGSMSELRNEKTKLPSDLIINATYDFYYENASLNILPVLGFQSYLDSEITHMHIGSEFLYDNQFALRIGYISGNESRNISAGAGVFWKGFNIDYAYTPFSYGIGNANTISLQYNF
ncbi:MAG: PorV/PorQ family protein [Ignavibacteriales bacterium]|nr:PorV/PorQ family protein [Ignavibacteriales bacterium]